MPAPIVPIAVGLAARLAAKKAAKEAAKKAAGSVSVRSKSVDTGTKRMVTKQNRAAQSYKIKDLDKLEKGQAQRAAKKARDAAERAKELKAAKRKGMVKGATATAALGTAGLIVAEKDKDKKKKKK
jgi:hypothetical protein